MNGIVLKIVSVTSVLIAMVLCEPAVQTAMAFSEENTVSGESTQSSEKDTESPENAEASKIEISFQPVHNIGIKRTLPFTEAEDIAGYLTFKGLKTGTPLSMNLSICSAEDMTAKGDIHRVWSCEAVPPEGSVYQPFSFFAGFKPGNYILKAELEDLTRKVSQECSWPLEILPKTEFRLLDIWFTYEQGIGVVKNPHYVEGESIFVRMKLSDHGNEDIELTEYVQQGDNLPVKIGQVSSVHSGLNAFRCPPHPKGKYTLIIEAKNKTTGQEVTYRLPFIVHEAFVE